MLFAFCLVGLLQPPVTPLKNPPDKVSEAAKYHRGRPTATSGAHRLASYQKRLSLEAESPFLAIPWRNVGPERQSGRVVDIESPIDLPGTTFVAFATGGLWRTDNDGDSWTSLFDNESAFAIGDFAVTRDGKTIWVGTGENNSQRTSYSGTGVFVSRDSGKTWLHSGLEDSHRIGRILIHPENTDTVYVGVLGNLYTPSKERGIYKTIDGGKSWRQVLSLDPLTGVVDLIFDPRDPNTLYASAWERERTAWNIRESGNGSGIYKSKDAGKTWVKLGGGLPSGQYMGRTGLAISPKAPNRIYAVIDNQRPDPTTLDRDERQPSGVLTPRRFLLLSETLFLQFDKPVLERFWRANLPSEYSLEEALEKVKAGTMKLTDIAEQMTKRNPGVFMADVIEYEVYRSDDAGKSWNRTHDTLLGLDALTYGYYCGRIAVSPHDENLLYVMSGDLVRSLDGGKTWESANSGMHPDHHAVMFDRRDPKRVWVGNDGGVYLSSDSGQKWRHLNNLSVGQFTTIWADNKTPYNVYGGLQDNGTMMGPSNYVPGRSDPSLWKSIGGGDGAVVISDPRENGVVYVGSQFGSQSGQNLDTRARWNLRPSAPRGDPPLRFNWVSPLIISPHHPDILYFAGNRVFRSLNQGRNWEPISPDLTKNLPQGDVPFSTIKEISESPFKFGVVYAGADDGSLKVTKNHGASWEDISTPAPTKWISRVVASKWEPGTVYVSQSGYRDDDCRAYLWKSTDFGKTWASIVGNLPDETINVIREDLVEKTWLHVGTDLGVFLSRDGGKTWAPYGGGIPRTPVHDLVIQPREDELVVASHARSVWIAPLKFARQLNDDIEQKELHIWSVPDMTRSPRWEFAPREPWDQTPIPSPSIAIQVWSKAAGEARLELVDSAKKIVIAKPVSLRKGINFLTLDLQTRAGSTRKPKPAPRDIKSPSDVLADPRAEERPQYVPTGSYSVLIVRDGHRAEVSWSLISP